MTNDIEAKAVNVIRGLAMDAPNAARSGHQGTAMALAPLAHVLWTRILRYDANDPNWPDRDRVILSAGHASILLYSMLHLTGYDLTIEDLRQFRQWGSKTPGHPEVGFGTPGIEVTTGPLGQGIANSVGMAVAERFVRATYGSEICDHRIWAICGDGDLSEGVSHEAASLAGHLKLDRLVWIYDDNHITIDGPTDISLGDDVVLRFRGYGWNVIELGEVANDLDAIETGLRSAMANNDAPTLVVLRSHIAYPSERFMDDPEAHGYVLKDDEIAATKAAMGLPPEKTFYVPDDVSEFYLAAGERGAADSAAWQERLDQLDEASLLAWVASQGGTAVPGVELDMPSWEVGEMVATRAASGKCLAAVAEAVPSIIAGGADLTSNTGTTLGISGAQSFNNPAGRQFYFGVREHAMAAIMNGMALHGGVLPVGGTFFVFTDYMRPAVRLAALSEAKVIFVWTHDSVGVGEDGPTHQPVEQLASVRAMPGLTVIRPADATETVGAWQQALHAEGPVGLVLSRQGLPVLAGTDAAEVEFGAYSVVESEDEPDLILIGTGSEVSVCVEAAQELAKHDIDVRVVSMPSWELFALQSEEYREELLPSDIPTLSVEAGSTFGWERWSDASIGIDQFGASAPGEVVLANYGMTAANVVTQAQALLESLDLG